MLKAFKQFINDNELCSINEKIILAVSGGIDSVVMTHLFHKAGYDFALAHCNFQLRAEESEEDMHFVESLSKKIKVPFYKIKFDTKKFALKNGISIQMAARELRFNWFKELLVTTDFDYIALAHHKNDVAETLLINLIRGTGISGLHGILPKTDGFIRPLLFAKREEIEEYAVLNNISFRIDSSNNEDKYIRNKLRINILPQLSQINPAIVDTFYKTAENIYNTEQIFNQKCEEVKNRVLTENNGRFSINKKLLQEQKYHATYLYHILKDFNFNSSQVAGMSNALVKHSGAIFHSDTHILINDRDCFIIQPVEKTDILEYQIDKNTPCIITPIFSLKFELLNLADINDYKTTDNFSAFLDASKLQYPLTLKKWRKGDSFVPLGMNHKMKVSDFLINNKVNLLDKEKILTLCNGNHIIWLVGMRIDNRYKINDKTKSVLKITFKNNI